MRCSGNIFGVFHQSVILLFRQLKIGFEFSTPECVMVRSPFGVGGMSRELHRLFCDQLIPSTWADRSPPILLNTWEAKYFDINHENIVDMAFHVCFMIIDFYIWTSPLYFLQASRIGIDLIVVDDGWFGKRDDDSSSLGDWFVNPKKFPDGLKSLVDQVNGVGCKFGLWFEPEMISKDSVRFVLLSVVIIILSFENRTCFVYIPIGS